jgi:hypothetical protein
VTVTFDSNSLLVCAPTRPVPSFDRSVPKRACLRFVRDESLQEALQPVRLEWLVVAPEVRGPTAGRGCAEMLCHSNHAVAMRSSQSNDIGRGRLDLSREL